MLSTSFDTRISRMGLVTFFSFCAYSTAHASALQELSKSAGYTSTPGAAGEMLARPSASRAHRSKRRWVKDGTLTTMVKESALCEHTRPGKSSSVQPPWLLGCLVRPCLTLTGLLCGG